MSWRAVVAALDDGEAFRSRVSLYLHPLAGRPLLWHVVQALLGTDPPPREVQVLHRGEVSVELHDLPPVVTFRPVNVGSGGAVLRDAVSAPGATLLVDGAAALITSRTVQRLLQAGEAGTAAVMSFDSATAIAVAGDGSALAASEDPLRPDGCARLAASDSAELLRVSDRHSQAMAAQALRDRVIRGHEARGVSFLLPATTSVDVDVRIGADTVIYPGVVLEGATVIGSECVIGPYSRIVESTVGRGSELAGWNYLVRTQLRNHAVLEAYARRGTE